MTTPDDHLPARRLAGATLAVQSGSTGHLCGCWVELRHLEPAHCAGLRSHFETCHPDQMEVFEEALARRTPKARGVPPSGLSQGELLYARAMRKLGTPLPEPVSFRTPERHDWLIPAIWIGGLVTLGVLAENVLGLRELQSWLGFR